MSLLKGLDNFGLEGGANTKPIKDAVETKGGTPASKKVDDLVTSINDVANWDANLVAGNIKNGINIFGVSGSYSEIPEGVAGDIEVRQIPFSASWPSFRSESWAPYPGSYPDPASTQYRLTFKKSGIYRIKFGLGGAAGYTTKARIHKNGIAYGVERTYTDGSSANYTEDLSFNKDDYMELYVWTSTASYVGQSSGIKIGTTSGNPILTGGNNI
jgi:hypothetical protein